MAKITQSSRRGEDASHPPPARAGPARRPRHGSPSPPPARHARQAPAAPAPGSSPRSPHAPEALRPSPRRPPALTQTVAPGSRHPRRVRPSPHPQSSARALGRGQMLARVRVTASAPRRAGYQAKCGSVLSQDKSLRWEGGELQNPERRQLRPPRREEKSGERARVLPDRKRGGRSFHLLHFQPGKRRQRRRLAPAAPILAAPTAISPLQGVWPGLRGRATDFPLARAAPRPPGILVKNFLCK